jgi:adenosine deaminase
MSATPKVELHLHLDCSLSYPVVSKLDPSISAAEYQNEFIAPPRCSSLADFLLRAPRGFQLMQTEAALELVTEDLFEQLTNDGVIYAEIRFAPLLHTQGALTASQVVAAVDRATERCIGATGIEARLILCTLRHFTPEQGIETVRLVQQFQGSRVVALDIAGDEAGHAIDPQIPAFRHAIENGLNRTAHAGEARGAESVWETLRAFEPSRIGHGVRSIEDAVLVEHLRSENIHLEVCPTSNLQTGIVEGYEDHAVDRLFRAGLSLGINTDTRTITNITLTQEYEKLRQHFGWGPEEILACNRAALNAAFVDQRVRQKLLQRLNATEPPLVLSKAGSGIPPPPDR